MGDEMRALCWLRLHKWSPPSTVIFAFLTALEIRRCQDCGREQIRRFGGPWTTKL